MINKELGERIINILEKINRDEYADYSTREQEEAKAILKEIRKENIYEQLGYHIRKEDNQKLLKEKTMQVL